MSTRGRKTGVRGRGANRGQGAAKAGNPVDAILVAMIAELRRELQEQWREIHELKINGHGGERQGENVPIAPQQQEGVVAATAPVPAVEIVARPVYQEPVLIRWRRVKPTDFEGTTGPLVAQSWLKTIEATVNLMAFIEIEQVLCASYCLTMNARIWWEGIKQRRDVNQMRWADFLKEFNKKIFHMNITQEHYD